MNLVHRLTKRVFRWTIGLHERRVARIERALVKARWNLGQYEEAGLTYLINVERKRVQYLEADLQKARKRLKEAQNVYVRAYISRYWQGKTLEDQMKEMGW